MKRRYWAGIIVGVIVVAGVAIYLQTRHASNTPYLPKAQASIQPAPTTQADTTPTPVSTTGPIPTSTAPVVSSNGLISLTSPTQGSTITSGTSVSGTAATAGGKLYYQVKGKQSGQLASGVVTVAPTGSTPTAFHFDLSFTNQAAAGEQGVLELYGLNASGAQVNDVSIGVYLQ